MIHRKCTKSVDCQHDGTMKVEARKTFVCARSFAKKTDPNFSTACSITYELYPGGAAHASMNIILYEMHPPPSPSRRSRRGNTPLNVLRFFIIARFDPAWVKVMYLCFRIARSAIKYRERVTRPPALTQEPDERTTDA
ncbi:hypothetical protein EVAR_76412_1 [Eumeta japonica]|uniref:Uncharacterized protein n=1 Tax=Eumeta variegata TaxID=151549 RepID=A0A4C1TAH8_EUMVA|nr:hypothetical protein EVAR_76412_1 [Eumeta japonica]